MTLIISLAAVWFFSGNPSQISFQAHDLMPHYQDPTIWVSLTGIILSFCGIEIATVHAGDVKDPQSAFPRALLYSVLIILVTLVLGGLAIAIVLPSGQISLVAGIMQAFDAFFSAYHMHWILPIVALMLVMGGLGSVSNWIIAPTKGLLVAAKDGNFPQPLQHENKYGAPTFILIGQAVIVSLLTLVFLFMPSVNGSYWLLTALASQLYMFMYLMMFAAAIYLRLSQPDQVRPFQVPGGNFGMWLVVILGGIGCITTICVGFIPPGNIMVGSTAHYETLLVIGLLVMSLPPVLCFKYTKPAPEIATA